MIIKNGLVFSKEGDFVPMTIFTDGHRITDLRMAIEEGRTNTKSGSHDTIRENTESIDVGEKYVDAEIVDAEIADAEIVDASGCYVIPGLTDIHFHGCMGHDFCDGTAEDFETIAEYEFRQGVTTICPATMTLPGERLSEILRSAATYREVEHSGMSYGDLEELFSEENLDDRGSERCDEDNEERKLQLFGRASSGRSELVGIHLEGPFLSKNKKGAQKEEYLQSPSAEKLRSWQGDARGLIRLVTLAPELPGALECMEACKGEFHFSVGHTECDYDLAMRAFEGGADHVTHLFNAMPPFGHRAPGVIGAAFDTGKCYAELICDGIHVAPSAVRAAFRLFGEDRMILISDSMEATGMPDGEYLLGGQKVRVKGKRATLEDGTLAGSVCSLYQCLCTATSMGIPLRSAIKASTINPCRSIGIEKDYGSIEIGKRAHLLMLDQRDLSIRNIISTS